MGYDLRTPLDMHGNAILNSPDLSAATTEIAIRIAWQKAQQQADRGFFVYSGCDLTPNATPTKLDMAAGVMFMTPWERVEAAQAAISTTIASLADATDPKWVLVEMNPTGNVVTFVQGTAAPVPAIPAWTSTRVPMGLLYVFPTSYPGYTGNVDTSFGVDNGNAKLLDMRQVKSNRPSRIIYSDLSNTDIGNVQTLTTLLNAVPTLPALSHQLGDTYRITAGGLIKINTTPSAAIELKLLVGSVSNAFDYTTGALTFDATNSRRWYLELTLNTTVVGASASMSMAGKFIIAGPNSSTNAQPITLGGGANGEMAIVGGALSNVFNSGVDRDVNLLGRITTSNAGSVFALRHFVLEKQPV